MICVVEKRQNRKAPRAFRKRKSGFNGEWKCFLCLVKSLDAEEQNSGNHKSGTSEIREINRVLN